MDGNVAAAATASIYHNTHPLNSAIYFAAVSDHHVPVSA